jgi:hypothetical protein
MQQLRIKCGIGILLSLAALAMSGCGSGSPFKYVVASGTVKYEDGSTIAGGCRLVFNAVDAAPVGNAYPRPGMATVNSDGTFSEVTSYKFGDGLVPGKHKVVVQAANERDGAPVVPKEYTSAETTPLVVDTANLPFEIKVPKPKGKR